ncbi:MAG TPA: prolipoprotein diacylglyceryl transferase family protein, partial [Polyangiaceae bacterium]|nr:prolipoprotein diacylglyceryl transferase family protein [Polyangiaceae bacterium]
GCSVFVGLLIADNLMGKEKRPRGALISWFFVLYFGGRLFTEQYKEIEALDPSSMVTMGQWLSFPGLLLGLYGLYRAYKRKEPAGWVEPGDEEVDDEDDEEEDDEEDEEGEDDATSEDTGNDDSTEDEDEDDKNSSSVDPDVDSEFEDGKLKKRRDP